MKRKTVLKYYTVMEILKCQHRPASKNPDIRIMTIQNTLPEAKAALIVSRENGDGTYYIEETVINNLHD